MNNCLCAPADCVYWHCREYNKCLLGETKTNSVNASYVAPKDTKKKRSQGQKNRQYLARQRKKVFDRDDHKCVYCGSLERLTLDHIKPLSKGGSGRTENLQTLCQPCNLKKSNHYPYKP